MPFYQGPQPIDRTLCCSRAEDNRLSSRARDLAFGLGVGLVLDGGLQQLCLRLQ